MFKSGKDYDYWPAAGPEGEKFLGARPVTYESLGASSDRSGSSVAEPDLRPRADALRVNLRGRSIRSGFIQIGAQAVQLALTVSSGVILARLLRPEDFGLLAMVSSLTAFVDNFRDFGFPMATVYRKTI